MSNAKEEADRARKAYAPTPEEWIDNPLGRMYQPSAAHTCIILGIRVIIQLLLEIKKKI